jgi:hypothetical protein
MRRAAFFLCACILTTSGAAAQTIPAAFQGSWKGTGSQADEPGVEWTIALTLAAGARVDVVGTITYPSLTCGGDLILREAEAGRVELLERITFGTCVDRGVVTLAPAHGGLSFDWRDDAGLTARGTLSRAQPPEP